MKYSEATKKNVVEMFSAGKSAAKIAKEMKIPTQTVYSWLKTTKKPAKKAASKAEITDKKAILKAEKTTVKVQRELELLKAENRYLSEKVQILESMV